VINAKDLIVYKNAAPDFFMMYLQPLSLHPVMVGLTGPQPLLIFVLFAQKQIPSIKQRVPLVFSSYLKNNI
ncbi:MAG: hypothetical protein PHD21_06740, partial [Flavobacteriales bacterium]|nr:hypothetical protein [Flavobacteriales bacterium]